MFRKKWIALLLFALVIVLAACNSDEDASTEETPSTDEEDVVEESPENEETTNDGEEATGATETVTIGYSGPLSGPAAFYGEDTLTGLQLAANEINEAGGFEVNGQQYEIELVSLDDQYLPDQAANNAKRLVQENDAKIIFNP